MAHELVPVDVTNNPVLRALGEEVKRTGTTRVLRANGEALVVVSPALAPRRRTSHPTSADIEAALAAAGSWKGLVDPEQLKQELDEARGADAPQVRL